MEEVGRIIGIYGRNIIRIAVPEEKLDLVSRPGAYIKVEGSNGLWLYAMIISFNLLDELYRRGRIIEEFEGYLDFRPSRNELVASLIGYVSNNRVIKGVPVLPKPGQRVYLVSGEELRSIMGDGEVEIGNITYQGDVPFKLKLNMLCSRHFAVLAMTGAGKSNTIAVVLSEIISKYSYPRIILLDTHSEYIPLKNLYPNKVNIFAPTGRIGRLVKARYNIEPDRLEVPLWTLGLEEIASLLRLGSQATKQLMYLRNAISKIRQEKYVKASVDDPIYFRADDLLHALQMSRGTGDRSLIDLRLKVENLLEDQDLYYITRPSISDRIYEEIVEEEPIRSTLTYSRIYGRLLKPGLNLIALGGLSSEAQASTVATILRSLWRVINAYIQAGHSIPTLIIVEEAHVYSPHGRWSPAKSIIEKIAKEGRKFGIGLGVVSQRPRELSQTVLAQCGTLIALRTANPEDQRHILNSMEDIVGEMIEGLSGLSVGEALVSGPAAPLPAIVKIYSFPDKYGVLLGGKDIEWSEEWSSKPEEVDVYKYIIGSLESYGESRGKRQSSLDIFME